MCVARAFFGILKMGKLEIKDREKKTVGHVVWKGDYEHGSARFVPLKSLSKEEKENLQSRYKEAVARGRALRKVSYRAPGMTIVKGLETFYGVAMVLHVVLPGNGLFVDWSTVVWPSNTPVTKFPGTVKIVS